VWRDCSLFATSPERRATSFGVAGAGHAKAGRQPGLFVMRSGA
jgi:hypothetical protein